MRRLVAGLALLFALPACGTSSHTISGTLTLQDTSSVTVGTGKFKGACIASPDSGYDDIDGHAQVTVTNSQGKIIGSSTLRSKGPTPGGECVWGFRVDGVADSDFYKVEVAHRGGLTFSKRHLEANGWKAQLTLG